MEQHGDKGFKWLAPPQRWINPSQKVKKKKKKKIPDKAKLTRTKSSDIWLIGSTQDQFGCCAELPGRGAVLKVFFDLHTKKNLNVTDSVKKTVAMVLPIWERAQIPTRAKNHCLNKLRLLFKEWQSLRKNTSRKSETEERKRVAFKDSLHDLFDIAHQDAMTIMQREDDRQFLRAQRVKGCHSFMADIEVKQEEEEVKPLTIPAAVAEVEERYCESKAVAMDLCPLDMSCDEEASSDSSDQERKPLMSAVKGNNNSSAAHTLAVPVTSLDKGGGRHC